MEKTEKIILAVIILLALFVGIFLLQGFIFNRVEGYFIKNKYYGFKLQTPESWVAIENTLYSEENIGNILEKCTDSKSVQEVGAFLFGNQKYLQQLRNPDYNIATFPSGATIEVIVNCIPDKMKNKIGSLILERIDQYFFINEKFQYIINEDIYVSTKDENKSEKIKKDYAKIFNKIISSFEVVK